jgi:hypothetical protein
MPNFLISILCTSFLFRVDSAKEDYVFAAGCSVSRLPLMAATRSWREGIHGVFIFENATFVDQLPNGDPFNETYLHYRDTRLHKHQGHLRAAMALLLAHKAIKFTYKWMLGGDDDTIYYLPNVMSMLSQYNHSLPYFISGNLLFTSLAFNRNETPFTNGNKNFQHPHQYAPRCLPCHHPQCLNASFARIPLACGCPCTPSLACYAETIPPYKGKQALCNNPNTRVAAYGGAGYIASLGLLQAVNHTQLEMCAKMKGGHGDVALSWCLWQQGFAITDPGLDWTHPTFGVPRFSDKCKHDKCIPKAMISSHVAARGFRSIEDAANATISYYRAYKNAHERM